MYQKTGVVHPCEDTEDFGRYEVTKKEQDRYIFKVPMMTILLHFFKFI